MKLVKNKSRKVQKVQYSNEITEYRHPLNLNESKVFWLFSSQRRPGEGETTRYSIPWACFKLLSADLNSSNKIQDILDSLRVKRLIVDRSGNKTLFGYISEASIDPGVAVTVKFPAGIHYLLKAWGNDVPYTTAHLACFLCMTSTYSSSLYLILCRHAYKNAPAYIIDLDELKHLLDIPQDAKAYKLYSNFKSRTLEPARRHFRLYCDITFTYEPVKEGRRVVAIKFKVRRKKAYQTTLLEAHHAAMNFLNNRIDAEDTQPAPGIIDTTSVDLTIKHEDSFIIAGDPPLYGSAPLAGDFNHIYFQAEEPGIKGRNLSLPEIKKLLQEGIIKRETPTTL